MIASGEEEWVFVAQVLRDGKYLENQTRLQDQVLSGLRIYEEWEKADMDIQKILALSENFFQIVDTDRYNKWKKEQKRKREEEGVDEVIWQEPDEEILEELRNFGF